MQALTAIELAGLEPATLPGCDPRRSPALSLACLQGFVAVALARRRPEPGLIWHSDQGSQFVSLAFGQKARAAGIAQSMDSRGDCWDNAVAESFFATLKSSSTAAPGRRRPSCAWRSSTTSRSSITASAAMARSVNARPLTSRTALSRQAGRASPLRGSRPSTRSSSLHQQRVPAPNQPLSTEAGELHRLLMRFRPAHATQSRRRNGRPLVGARFEPLLMRSDPRTVLLVRIAIKRSPRFDWRSDGAR
jgi:hypothetical protein